MLYDSRLEKDNCGFGLIAHTKGQPSHKLVRTAITGLDRMQHRGGIAADGKTGDGCGLLLQKPDGFFRAVAAVNDWHLGKNYAVGMLFLNPDPIVAEQCKKIISQERINIERRDIDAEIETLVSRTPNSEKEIRRFYKKPSNRQRIEDDITEKKILEYLGQFAKVKEVEVNTKDIRGENK